MPMYMTLYIYAELSLFSSLKDQQNSINVLDNRSSFSQYWSLKQNKDLEIFIFIILRDF